jgi:superfamily II DNA or RNA helicase
MKLRTWQQQAVDRLTPLNRSILEACPGSGKTALAGAVAKTWRDTGQVDCVLAIAPSRAIKDGFAETWSEMFGLSGQCYIVRSSKSGRDLLQPPHAVDALLVTYHELVQPTSLEALKRWHANGWTFGIILDEIHHATDDKRWGDVVGDVGRDLATRSLIMTGTPFRTDGQPITLMEYITKSGRQIAEPDFKYCYRDAVNDDEVRPLTCRWVDGEVTILNGNRYRKRLHELTRQEAPKAARECFRPDGPFMRQMIEQVNNDLQRLRSRPEYSDSAALFVCQPSRDTSQEDNHARRLARAIKRYTGEDPEVVVHADGDGPARIIRFKKGTRPFIVAINMVSEGVNIPRIRSVAYCRYTESEMLFRQIAGRATRKTLPNDQQASQLYVPAFPAMQDFGERLWDESREGLKERQQPTASESGNPDSNRDSETITCLDAEGRAGAGHVDHVEVESRFIERGEHLINAHVAFRHYNQVQLGAMLKFDAEYRGKKERFGVTPNEERGNQLDRLRRRVARLAHLKFSDDLHRAYLALYREFRTKSFEDIRETWTVNQIDDAARWAEDQLSQEPFDRGTR